MKTGLQGKVALITGASRGIGKAIALLIASGAPNYFNGTVITTDAGIVGV